VRRPGRHALAATYRCAWCTVAALACALGFAAGCVFLGGLPAACLAGVGAVLGVAAGSPQPGPPSGRGRRAAVAGLLAAVLPVAGIGLLAALGAAGLLLCLLLAAGALPLRRRTAGVRRLLPGVPRPAPAPLPPAPEMLPPDPLPALAALPGLATAQLCTVWRVSYARLQRCTWPGERDHLAQLRRACLDELERRDPRAFARWVGTARAAGDPGRFFLGQQSSS
jgi:hypothetical protein